MVSCVFSTIYSSKFPRVYKSKSIHSCFKFFLLIILFSVIIVSLPLFLFFLTSYLYYSPPLSCCQVFFEKLQNKKAGHLPCFLVLRFKFFPSSQTYFIVMFTDFCQVCFRRLKISATRISCGTW